MVFQVKGKTVKAVTFDLDGVLLDSCQRYVNSFGLALEKQGVTSRISRTGMLRRRRAGMSGKDIYRELFPGLDQSVINEADELRKRISVEENLFLDRPFAGVKSFLTKLRNENLDLAILTFRPDEQKLTAQLEALAMKKFFGKVVLGHDPGSLTERKVKLKRLLDYFHLSPEEMVFVDDTEYGLRAARSLGLITIGVLSGLSGLKVLEREKPDMILRHITDLLKTVSLSDA